MLKHFNPKREKHVLCHIIYRLWEVSFVRKDDHALEVAVLLAKSLGGIQARKLCDKLTGCLFDSLPEDEMLFYNLFEHNFRVLMQSKGLDTERKRYDEEVSCGAHDEYVVQIEESEKSRHLQMIEITIRTKEFFRPPVSEALIYEFYMAMNRELSNVFSLARLKHPKNMESSIAKIVGELYKLGIYKPETTFRALAKCISPVRSVDLLTKYMHDGTRDEHLNGWIRMYWHDMLGRLRNS